jgi:uncharacterized protein YdaU (DUF1376 family)
MVTDKLLAEWFWIDRWTGSSAFALPLEARGLYREMLTQAWRRGARLPNDPGAIQRFTAVTAQEWKRCWPQVQRFWRVDGTDLVNDTQLEIYRHRQVSAAVASDHARRGARARWSSARAVPEQSASNARAMPEHVPEQSASNARAMRSRSGSEDVPSPPYSPPPPRNARAMPEHMPEHRSKRPIYTGHRLTVFEWQLDDLMKMLGKHADAFDLHQWFDTLDKRALASDEVMPKRDGGRWLQQETLAEVRRRGLAIAGESDPDPYAGFTEAWTCRVCGQVHEGTAEQARRGDCLSRTTRGNRDAR